MANSILAKMAVLISGDTSGLNKGIKSATKELSVFEKTAKGVAATLATSLGAISFGVLAKEIFNVTSDFQRFEAVLTNTLGSSSAAQIALRNIEEFAKRTPFAVDELTNSFVKLANQGFKPSTEELRKLGDLASSTGKGFDQLTEAIIDAQVGEFERLKEFGIRAKKQGDLVTFTFKGVETQTKFTSTAIRDYILSLGDAEGVSGSMAKISETLGGQMSNLGDSWTQFLKVIGDGNKGPLSGAIAGLGNLLGRATEFLKTNNQIKEGLKVDAQATIVDELKELVSISGDVDASSQKLISRLEEQKEAIVAQAAPLFANFDANEKTIEVLERKAATIDAQIVAINDYTTAETKRADAEKASAAASIQNVGLIQQIENELKQLEIDKKKAFGTGEITQFNVKIDELRDKLDLLNASRPLTDFAEKQLKNATLGIKTNVDIEQGTGFKRTLENQFPTELPAPDVSLLMNNIQMATGAVIALKDAYGQVGGQAITTADQQILAAEMIAEAEQRKAQTFQQVAGIIGETVGDVISGQQTVLQAIKSATAKLLPILLSQALAGTIAGAGKTAAPPPVIVALATAGIAAVSALFRSATGHGGGGGGGGMGSSNLTNVSKFSPATSQSAQPQQFEFVLHGDDLVANQTTQLNRNLRLGR